MTNTNPTLRTVYDAIDPRTGCRLRDASAVEIAAYQARVTRLRDAVLVGAVLVDSHVEGAAHTPSAWDWL
jgi:hypothetical protein